MTETIHYTLIFHGSFIKSGEILDNPFARTGITTCSLSYATNRTIYWIHEALDLRHAGMPPSAYRLHLEAPIDIAQHVWNTIKSLAAWCLANTRYLREARETPLTNTNIANDNQGLECDIFQERLLVPNVRLLLSGDPTVQFPCPIGTLEEFEQEAGSISNALRGQPRDAWRQYGRNLLQGDLDASEYNLGPTQELYADYWA